MTLVYVGTSESCWKMELKDGFILVEEIIEINVFIILHFRWAFSCSLGRCYCSEMFHLSYNLSANFVSFTLYRESSSVIRYVSSVLYWYTFLLVYLKRWIYLKGRVREKRKIHHLLVHSPSVQSGCSRAGVKLGASPCGCRASVLGHPPLLAQAHGQSTPAPEVFCCLFHSQMALTARLGHSEAWSLELHPGLPGRCRDPSIWLVFQCFPKHIGRKLG